MAIYVAGTRPRPILVRKVASFKGMTPKVSNPRSNEVLRVFEAVYTLRMKGS